jgi:hypothetical protein
MLTPDCHIANSHLPRPPGEVAVAAGGGADYSLASPHPALPRRPGEGFLLMTVISIQAIYNAIAVS